MSSRSLRRCSWWLVMLGLLVTACSPGAGEATEDQGEAGAPATGGGDGTLVIAVGGEPSNLNPVFGDIFGTIYGDHWPMFSSLLDYDADLELVADLAAEMPTLSSGATEAVVELREDVTWHDGEPFTAEDVVFTYDSILDTDVATGLRDQLFDSLEAVEAVDDHTVRFTLSRTDPAFLHKLTTGIVPRHLLEDEDLNTASFNLDPVGTGPFVFSELREGERMVMTANPDYYSSEVGLERIVVRFVSDENAMVSGLEAGTIDVTATPLSPRVAERFRGGGRFEVASIPGELLTLTLPTSNPLFADAEVRRAVGMAIDRELLVAGLVNGAGRPVYGPFPPGHWAHDPDVTADHDPGRAEQILADRGWVAGEDGVRRRDGERFAFELVYGHGNTSDPAALAIRDALAAIGVEIDLAALEFGDMQERVAAGAASLQSLGNAYDPDLDVFRTYHSSFSDDDPGTNPARVEDAAVDAAVEAGRSATERQVRQDAYSRLQEALAAQGSWHYLLQGDDVYVVASRVEGVDPQPREGHVHGFSRGLLWNLEDWRLTSG